MLQEGQGRTFTLNQPVFIIGFMGAGKSTVSQCLAALCGMHVVDADGYLETRERRVIADIFSEDGEDHFRRLETECLAEIAQGDPCLVSCGGGVVKRPENVRIMKEAGFVVYLAVTAEVAAARIPDAQSRPLFKNLEVARRTVAERAPLYEAAADVRIEADNRPVSEIAAEIRDILMDRGILSTV
jgi:shikimate kinase